MHDEEIIRLIKQGNKNLFVEIVKRYYKSLENLIIKVLPKNPNTEDIIQEIFLRVFEKLNTYDESKSFRPWLYKVAYNICLKYTNESKNLNKISLQDFEIKINNNFESPDTITINKLMIDEIISKLSFNLQIVFILRHGLEFSYEEISYVLDESIGTIKTHLHRARKILIRILDEYLNKANSSNVSQGISSYTNLSSYDN